jgi:hypothetical protein
MDIIAAVAVVVALIAWILAAMGTGVDSRPGFGDEPPNRD